jgi:hypothetical protein
MTTNTNIITHTGGKVINSGGFGCIFSPALKCENDETDYSSYGKDISKLMTTKYATEEFNQIQTFKTVLQTIPNYDNYFLLKDITLCRPAKLTKYDLKHYKKCKALKKKGIHSRNINHLLDNLLVINMPNGGIDIEDFVQSYFIPANIVRLNNSLIRLLVYGIVPMNNLNVYHCDIKDGNILVKSTEIDLETRLIDWGLSFIQTSKKGVPKNLYRRPFQYNVPFSSVLFNKEFSSKYTLFLQANPSPAYFQIREFVINYIFDWNKIRGPGHLSAINDIIRKLTKNNLMTIKKRKVKEHFIEYEFTYYYIVEYLSKILEEYTKDGRLSIMDYFNNVFLKNIDIWGFTMSYIVLYEYIYDSFEIYNDVQLMFLNKIKFIITHFLYENPLIPIDVSLLTLELTSLNPILEKMVFIKNGGIRNGGIRNGGIRNGGIRKPNTKTKQKTKFYTNKTRKKR